MKHVEITPKSQRARNRVNEHGNIMLVLQEGQYEGTRAVLLESLNRTWGKGDFKSPWVGWITEKEADWNETECE